MARRKPAAQNRNDQDTVMVFRPSPMARIKRGPSRARHYDPSKTQRFHELFNRLGFPNDLFERCGGLLDAIADTPDVRLQVELAATDRPNPRAVEVVEHLDAAFADPAHGVGLIETSVSLRDVAECIVPLMTNPSIEQYVDPGPLRTRLMRVWFAVQKLLKPDRSGSLMTQMDALAWLLCQARNPRDRPYVFPTKTWVPKTRGQAIGTHNYTIGVAPHVCRQIEIDGAPRWAYRVGIASTNRGVHWIDAPGTVLDREHPIPVYLQEHADRRLLDRLLSWRVRLIMDAALCVSIGRGHVVKRQGDNLWLSVGAEQLRLGYFIATPIDDVLLIRTFLAVTMRKTPEGKRFREAMGDQSHLIETHGLDQLTPFLTGTMPEIPCVRSALEAAGCGHLIEIAANPGKVDMTLSEYAADNLRRVADLDMDLSRGDRR